MHWDPSLNVWVVSRHSDVSELLRHPKWSSNSVLAGNDSNAQPASPPGRVLLFMDPPEHTGLRRLVSKSIDTFVPALAEFAVTVAAELAEGFSGRSRVDLISEFAAPLSLRVLARLLGVPDRDLPILAGSASEFSGLIDWTPSAAALDGARNQGAELTPYLLNLVTRKRREPGNDLISALLKHTRDRSLRYADVLSTAILILAAGHVTSTHMLGNGMLTLLQHRAVLDSCLAGRYPTVHIVNELLRFNPPVQMTPRTALEDIQMGAFTIQRGSMALALLASANRDRTVFQAPDDVDPSRRTSMALSFGAGRHFCIGAEIGRSTGVAGFDTLLRLCPRLRLAQEPLIWKPTITQRGLKELWVAL